MTVLRLRRAIFVVAAAGSLVMGLAAPAAAQPAAAQWDPTLPKILSAGAPGDPLSIANASLAATAQATQITMDLGRKFLSTLGFGPPAGAAGVVRGPAAIEYVIRRGGSQMGTPYSWGGGKPNGPSRGDCRRKMVRRLRKGNGSSRENRPHGHHFLLAWPLG